MTTEEIFFAAGCFWGVEDSFAKIPGVVNTEVGYMGGTTENPTYEKVCTGGTGYAETVRVEFDPQKVRAEDLIRHFFKIHDPTTVDRQGPDIGNQYRSAIFVKNSDEDTEVRKIIEELTKNNVFPKAIVTEVSRATRFYRAEEYHQKYFEKNGGGVCHI